MMDHFAAGRTPAHRLDPAAKTVALLAVVLAVVLVGREHFLPLALPAAALAAYHAVSRTPLGYTLRHMAIVSPFVAVMALAYPVLEPGEVLARADVGPWALEVTREGLLRAADVTLRFVLSVWAAILLLATTRFQDMLMGLSRLRVPRVLVVQLAFMYRYLWILMDQAMRQRMAQEARDGGHGPWRVRFRARVGLVGVLMVRTWDRAERIYWAMSARGFDGSMPAPAHGAHHPADWAFAAAVVAGAAALVITERCLYA